MTVSDFLPKLILRRNLEFSDTVVEQLNEQSDGNIVGSTTEKIKEMVKFLGKFDPS